MKHEDRKRELALKAEEVVPGEWKPHMCFVMAERDDGKDCTVANTRKGTTAHIAFNDPATAILEADVIAWARLALNDIRAQWPHSSIAECGELVISALDAHAAAKEKA